MSVRRYVKKGVNNARIGPSLQLQSEFRYCSMAKEIICSFFELSQSLHKGLIQQKLSQFEGEIEEMDGKKEILSLDRSRIEEFDFDEWESRLW